MGEMEEVLEVDELAAVAGLLVEAVEASRVPSCVHP